MGALMGAVKTRRAQVSTCALHGVQTVPVSVEIAIGGGLPGIHIVGMGDTSIQEARHRFKSAIRAAGFEMNADRHIVVNLAPASVRKHGAGFDLPIAVAYLVATGQLPASLAKDTVIVGELSLQGEVRPVDGLFAYALSAQQQGKKLLSAQPQTSLPQLHGLDHRCLEHLAVLRDGKLEPPRGAAQVPACAATPDYRDVVGQDVAVRAMVIAAAGGHGVLLMGPPGSGKSMLARRLPGIMPPLDEDERIETALIHSVAGFDVTAISAGQRPFRAPHHSATTVALVGGGSPLRPGEVSLAHHGALFLDELGEFSASALQTLRQPLEDGEIALCRVDGRAVFPADFQLVAASNPCPCGYLGDRSQACHCTDAQVERYQSKLGGPLRDRIDLVCRVNRVDPALVMKSGDGATSAQLRQRVMAARERAAARGDRRTALAATSPHEVVGACGLGVSQRRLLEDAARVHRLSGRGIVRTLRVARTIADVEDSAKVCDEHLLEALGYRVEGGAG